MGGNINDLKTTLAAYKATISIALGGTTFRQATVASAVIDRYKTMIEEATSDLQEHLQDIEERLQSLDQHGGPVQRSDAFILRDIREEKESTEQCLTICTRVAQVIAHLQKQLPQFHSKGENMSIQFGSGNGDISGQSHNLTSAMLTDFGARVSSNSEALQARLMELTNRLRQMSEQGIMSEDPTNLNLIKEERESIIQCLNVCSEASELAHRARTNIFEDVTSSDESHQLVVSTIGDLISAKHIITGSKSAQWLGQMSDTSLQQLSRDFRGQVGIGEEPPSRAEKNEFNTRYGSVSCSEKTLQGAEHLPATNVKYMWSMRTLLLSMGHFLQLCQTVVNRRRLFHPIHQITDILICTAFECLNHHHQGVSVSFCCPFSMSQSFFSSSVFGGLVHTSLPRKNTGFAGWRTGTL
ncbi:hypothetical protein AtubIFM54640_011307 [Aspergillus tubingensis]|nr:hypothetical protein AtubIFM54640_011307 [Aspergillus tubingensis]